MAYNTPIDILENLEKKKMTTHKDQYCDIKMVATIINNWIEHKFDGLIGISGERGQGKSVLSRLIARELSPIMCGKPLVLEDTMTFSRKEFYERAKSGEKKRIYLLDEAVGIFFNRDRMEQAQIELVKLMNVCRSDFPAIFMNIPILWNLDKGIRDLIRIYIYVEMRPINGQVGYAHIFVKTNGPFDYDPWHLKENQRNGLRFSRSPNYRGTIVLNDMSNEPWFVELEKEADIIKDRKKLEAVEDDNAKDKKKNVVSPEVKNLVNYCRKLDLFDRRKSPREELCKYFNISYRKYQYVFGPEGSDDNVENKEESS